MSGVPCRSEAHVEEQGSPKPEAAGSNPVTPAIRNAKETEKI